MLKTDLPWETLGAIPEMLQTAWGSLFKSLQLKKGDRLLVRGGTTSVGLAAAAIAKKHGAYVAATTRSAKREALVKSSGADHVFIDDGAIAKKVKEAGGFDKVGKPVCNNGISPVSPAPAVELYRKSLTLLSQSMSIHRYDRSSSRLKFRQGTATSRRIVVACAHLNARRRLPSSLLPCFSLV